KTYLFRNLQWPFAAHVGKTSAPMRIFAGTAVRASSVTIRKWCRLRPETSRAKLPCNVAQSLTTQKNWATRPGRMIDRPQAEPVKFLRMARATNFPRLHRGSMKHPNESLNIRH